MRIALFFLLGNHEEGQRLVFAENMTRVLGSSCIVLGAILFLMLLLYGALVAVWGAGVMGR